MKIELVKKRNTVGRQKDLSAITQSVVAADLFSRDEMTVELRSTMSVCPDHQAKLTNYLMAKAQVIRLWCQNNKEIQY